MIQDHRDFLKAVMGLVETIEGSLRSLEGCLQFSNGLKLIILY
jgi:hypothetical protein